jgi:hypothetical protein
MNIEKSNKIDKIVEGIPNRLRESYFSKRYPELYDEIILYTNSLELTFVQKIYHWINDLPSYYTCRCGSKTTFNKNWKDGYRTYCSPKCAQQDDKVKEKRKQTCKEKYGVENTSQLEEIKEKIKKTCKEKYNTEYAAQADTVKIKIRETNLERYGVSSPSQLDIFKEKSKQTNIKKCGYDSVIKNPQIKDNIKKTCITKYGVENPPTQEVQNFSNLIVHSNDKPAEVQNFLN